MLPHDVLHMALNCQVLCVLERECDLDKHCGVLDPDRKKICTRLLTCNVSFYHVATLHFWSGSPVILR